MKKLATYLAGIFLSLTCAASGISKDVCCVADSSRLNKLSVQVFFKIRSAEVDTGYKGNGKNIASFLNSMDSLANTPPPAKELTVPYCCFHLLPRKGL